MKMRFGCVLLSVCERDPVLKRRQCEDLLDLAYVASPRAVLIEGDLLTTLAGLHKRLKTVRRAPVPMSRVAVHLDASGVRGLFQSEAGFAASILARRASSPILQRHSHILHASLRQETKQLFSRRFPSNTSIPPKRSPKNSHVLASSVSSISYVFPQRASPRG